MLDAYNLYPLHIFRLVARGGSVTRAAQELFISQPAVSAHLKALETAIGEPLFERTPRGMQLTPAGTILLEQANRLFALYEEIPATVDAVRGRVRGEVIVAASSTPGAYLVPALLRQFQERYPEVRPVLRVGDSAEVLEWLLDYQAPLGVIGEMSIAESLHSVEIGSDRLQLVAVAGDALCRVKQVKPEHLRGRTLFLREQGSSTRAGAESLLGERLKEFERIVEVPSAEAIKQAVAVGLGVAVLSSWATRLEETAGLLQPVRDPLLRQSRRFFLVKRKDRELIGAAAAIWDCLITCKSNTVSRKRRAGAVKSK
ncbi:MAG TPA: LysR family transcriptional regulator [Blastocatellia bacterium]|nr:LysR family transcriptional regulator [Blastocatellia bacterium]